LERVLALLKAGKSIEARIAIMAITTNNSIRVNAFLFFQTAFKIPTLTTKPTVCVGRSGKRNCSLLIMGGS
jgi:hypothetical protein